MSVVLVTGGAGFIGSNIVDALVRRGDQVRVLDDLSTGKAANLSAATGVSFIQGSVCDRLRVREAIQGAEYVFHQAALASVPRSVEDPVATHEACVTGTVMLLDEARRAKVKRVVFAGSSSAYGDQPWVAKRETDTPMPLSPYAAAKVAAEQYCAAFFRTYGLETVCLRYFNVFGPRQDPNGAYAAVIPKFIASMIRDERPVIFGDGRQSRDFTYIDDIVAGNLLAASRAGVAGGTFNIATGHSFTLLQLVAALNRVLEKNLAPVFEPARLGDVRDSMADISTAQAQLEFLPMTSFEDGLRQTVAFFRNVA